MMCEPLPADEVEFFELMKTFFPCHYDIKYLARSCKSLSGGLDVIANSLDIKRVGKQHQAGSDSHITGHVFFNMKSVYFDGCIDEKKYQNVLANLNPPPQNSNSIARGM